MSNVNFKQLVVVLCDQVKIQWKEYWDQLVMSSVGKWKALVTCGRDYRPGISICSLLLDHKPLRAKTVCNSFS